MFDIGFSEIVLIFGIALIVLGPKRLPKLAADIGRWAGRARAMSQHLRSQLEQLEREAQIDPLQEQPKATPTSHTPPPTDVPSIQAPPADATATGHESTATDAPPAIEAPAPPVAAKPDESKPAWP